MKVKDLGSGTYFGVKVEQANGGAQIEAARTARARIKVQDSFAVFDGRAVGVAVKNGREPCSRRIEVERADVVEKIDVVSLEEKDVRFGQAATGACAIHVAAHGMHGGNFGERFEDRGIAHVAEVENVVHTG